MNEHETRRGRETSYDKKFNHEKNASMNAQIQHLPEINTYIAGVNCL